MEKESEEGGNGDSEKGFFLLKESVRVKDEEGISLGRKRKRETCVKESDFAIVAGDHETVVISLLLSLVFGGWF